uniref:non-specific serine/threonine protein kinase n=1 Tax=Fagus sylvatica TaxID=28930 RepID=A0A2N9EBR1_FAGSY
MNSQVFFPSPSLVLFFITILVLVQIPMFLCYDWYSSCKNQYSCGYITDIGYPFWGDGRVSGCGNPSLYLSCEHNTTFIDINNVKYLVLGVNTTTNSLKIARNDSWGGVCSLNHVNTTLDSNLFVYSPGYGDITLVYGCPSVMPGLFNCNGIGSGYMLPGAHGPDKCKVSVVFPVLQGEIQFYTENMPKMEEDIKEGFVVNWIEDKSCSDCIQSKGVCGYDVNTNQSTCYCSDQTHGPKPCPSPPPSNKSDQYHHHIIIFSTIARVVIASERKSF